MYSTINHIACLIAETIVFSFGTLPLFSFLSGMDGGKRYSDRAQAIMIVAAVLLALGLALCAEHYYLQ